MLISVIVPTVPGREEIFAQVCNAYLATTPDIELIIEKGHPTVGCAWQAGAEKATGEYIHMGNDDTEPHDGWWQPAVEAVDMGYVPAPQVISVDGTWQSQPKWGEPTPDWTPVETGTIPFIGRDQWEAVSPLLVSHYYSDNFISWRAAQSGWPCVLRSGFMFTHHWAQAHRGAGMGTQMIRDTYDKHLFQAAQGMVERGEWNAPWPPGGRL